MRRLTELSFDGIVLKSCFAQLRQLTKFSSFLSTADFKKVILAFISSRPDYCEALNSVISRCNIQRLHQFKVLLLVFKVLNGQAPA